MSYDVVIPYRENNSLELRYSVMSLVKNLPHNQIHIIGDKKTGTNHVRHSWVNRPSPFMDVESKVIQACEELVTTDHFWYSNDDFFVMKQMDTIPVFHRGTLQEAIEKRRYRDTYTVALTNTLEYLRRQGIGNPLNYEVHIPMLFNTKKRIDYFELARPVWRRQDLLMRSIYGNLEGLGGTRIEDVKNIRPYEGVEFVSTDERTFKGELGEYIKKEFS